MVYVLHDWEDSMKLQELMDLYTKLSDKVLDLENVKDAQSLEIKKIESSAEKSLGDQEDASKQGRNEIVQDEVNTASIPITTASTTITTAEPVTTASAPVTTTGVSVSTAEPSTPPITTTPIEDEDLTIANPL
ncbi:hypothetical protein Tco_0660312 [Tanacetum coccineum]